MQSQVSQEGDRGRFDRHKREEGSVSAEQRLEWYNHKPRVDVGRGKKRKKERGKEEGILPYSL